MHGVNLLLLESPKRLMLFEVRNVELRRTEMKLSSLAVFSFPPASAAKTLFNFIIASYTLLSCNSEIDSLDFAVDPEQIRFMFDMTSIGLNLLCPSGL